MRHTQAWLMFSVHLLVLSFIFIDVMLGCGNQFHVVKRVQNSIFELFICLGRNVLFDTRLGRYQHLKLY